MISEIPIWSHSQSGAKVSNSAIAAIRSSPRTEELGRCRRAGDNLIGRRLQSSLMTRSARRGYCVVRLSLFRSRSLAYFLVAPIAAHSTRKGFSFAVSRRTRRWRISRKNAGGICRCEARRKFMMRIVCGLAKQKGRRNYTAVSSTDSKEDWVGNRTQLIANNLERPSAK